MKERLKCKFCRAKLGTWKTVYCSSHCESLFRTGYNKGFRAGINKGVKDTGIMSVLLILFILSITMLSVVNHTLAVMLFAGIFAITIAMMMLQLMHMTKRSKK